MPVRGAAPFATFLIIGRKYSQTAGLYKALLTSTAHSNMFLPRHPLRQLPLRLQRPLDHTRGTPRL